MRRRLTYDVMTDVQKAELQETLEDMLEELDLAQSELGAGMTYGRCVFRY
jgi:hypothetical protein